MARRESLLALPLIAGLILGVYVACLAVASLAGLPWDLGLPWSLRLAGLPLLAYGLAMMGWVFRHRGLGSVMESTWMTLRKLAGREPVSARGGRTEPLVVAGPYRLVRHPLYSGVDGLVVGTALLVDHPWAYLGATVMWIWFAAVLAPFEERELIALFGEPYRAYMETHRRFFPVPRRPG